MDPQPQARHQESLTPRVLFLDESFASRTDSGKRIRTIRLLEKCSEYFDITYVAYSQNEGETRAARDRWEPFGIRILPLDPPRVHKAGLRQILTGARVALRQAPASVAAWKSRRYASTVDLLMEEEFHLVHCEISQMGWAVPRSPGPPRVLNAHNIETVIWERLADTKSFPVDLFFRDQARKMARYEQELVGNFDRIICVSELDQSRFKERFGAENTVVVPNGAEGFDTVIQPPPIGPTALLYPAALDWRPAQDGAVFLLKEILPEIRRYEPGVTLKIVGKGAPSWLLSMCNDLDGVTCHSDVPDMAPFYRDSHLTVVPLRVGSGSRIKILESFGYGRPVVSTSIGAEGLDVDDTRHLLIADDASSFARGVLKIIQDPELGLSLSRSGKRLAETTYNWNSIAMTQVSLWEQLIQDHLCP